MTLLAVSAAGAIGIIGVVVLEGCVGRREGGVTFGVDARTHEPFFPVETGKHALGFEAFDGAISCESCHASSTSFSEPSCIGCHEHERGRADADHAGLTDYRYASPSCLTSRQAIKGPATELLGRRACSP